MPGAAGGAEPRARGRVHALRDRRRCRATSCSRAQRRNFDAADGGRWPALGARGYLRHAANSAALLADPSTWFDLVRPGLLLYGVAPPALRGPGRRQARHEPAQPRRRPSRASAPGRPSATAAGSSRGRPTTMAVVPAGYADGLDTRLDGRGFGARARPARAHRRLGLHGHDHARRHRDDRGAGRRGRASPGARATTRSPSREMAALGRRPFPYELLCRVGTAGRAGL